MCIFILVTLPAGADIAMLEPIFHSHQGYLGPATNAHLQRQLPANERLFHTTTGHCDCDSGLRDTRPHRAISEEMQKKRNQFRRKGWSKSKIARALAESERAMIRANETHRETNIHDIERWYGLLTDALNSAATSHIGILLHMYETSTDVEEFTILRTETLQLSHIPADQLGPFTEDVLYIITP
ncbi:MAG: hypothetical protein BWY76_01894 [bacterium ADurb.Bin429]|nr:MAG: hypothetical protein BWY76_01894 [bacterium ADurb.Bin429]